MDLFLSPKKLELPINCLKIYFLEENFMDQVLIVLVFAVALIILYFYQIRSRKGWGKQGALWQECRRKLRPSLKAADETIERYIKSLKKAIQTTQKNGTWKRLFMIWTGIVDKSC
jgi:hypothetical protein